jgi:hypothetical protein
MNPLEYLISGFLAVMAAGTWALMNAIGQADDGFQNEYGFQVGIAPPVLSLYPRPVYAPAAPARAVVPEITHQKSPRRPQNSKPPMLPVDLRVTDLNPSTERKSRQERDPQETTPPFDNPSTQ